MRTPRLVAGAWLLGTAASLLLAVVLIGCCALPFHGVVHEWLPCHVAQAALSTHSGESPGHPREPATPAQPKRERDHSDPQRLTERPDLRSSPAAALLARTPATPPGAAAQRSRLPLGATRCDDDVGTRLALLDTLRI
jgi:hypothetical protein